jgi:hypothetical protein
MNNPASWRTCTTEDGTWTRGVWPSLPTPKNKTGLNTSECVFGVLMSRPLVPRRRQNQLSGSTRPGNSRTTASAGREPRVLGCSDTHRPKSRLLNLLGRIPAQANSQQPSKTARGPGPPPAQSDTTHSTEHTTHRFTALGKPVQPNRAKCRGASARLAHPHQWGLNPQADRAWPFWGQRASALPAPHPGTRSPTSYLGRAGLADTVVPRAQFRSVLFLFLFGTLFPHRCLFWAFSPFLPAGWFCLSFSLSHRHIF